MCDTAKIELILKNLDEINEKLDKIIENNNHNHNHNNNDISEKEDDHGHTLDVMTLLTLPEHLRTTATTLFELGTATADSVAEITKKERAVESNYLNQLVRMGHVKKQRLGRKVYFLVDDK